MITLQDNETGLQEQTFPNDAAPSPYATDPGSNGTPEPTPQALPRDATGSTTQQGNGYSYFNPWGEAMFICPTYIKYANFAGFSSHYCQCFDQDASPCGSYNPQQGRWMNPESNPDVLNPQSFNEYSYAANDPTSQQGTDDQGKASLSQRDQQRYDENRANLLNELQNVSDPCATLFGDLDLTPDVVRDAVRRQRPWDGKRSCISNRDAGTFNGTRPTEPEARRAYDAMMSGPVSLYFNDGGDSTTWAVSQLGGPDVYFRPGGTFSTTSVSAGTILHESLHNLGEADPDIQSAWNLSTTSGSTDNITQKLIDAGCVKK